MTTQQKLQKLFVIRYRPSDSPCLLRSDWFLQNSDALLSMYNTLQVEEAKDTEQPSNAESDDKELEELTAKLRSNLEIKDRKYLMTTYPQCFVGSEAVTFMVENGITSSRSDAVELGKLLMAADVIRHVTNDHEFKDENKYYSFSADLPSHGAKMKKEETNEDWTWSDFIPGKLLGLTGDDEKYNLQPQIEELNAEVEAAVDSEDIAPAESFGITPLDEHNKKLLDNVHPLKWVDPEPQPKYNMVAIGAGAGGLVTAAGTLWVYRQSIFSLTQIICQLISKQIVH